MAGISIKTAAGLISGIDAVEWAMKANRLGAGEILLTSMDCDGTKAGYDIELTRTDRRKCVDSGDCIRWCGHERTFL